MSGYKSCGQRSVTQRARPSPSHLYTGFGAGVQDYIAASAGLRVSRRLATMSQPQISIVGAGISGLVLARCIRSAPSITIFDKDSARRGSSRNSYGITLHPWAYRPLLKYLDLDEALFRRKIAVDAATGGIGWIESPSHPPIQGADAASFRANRQKLEQMLREGLDIRWDHTLLAVKSKESSSTLHFSNGTQTESTIVVGADGVHSQVRRNSVSPSVGFNILPFVVYNGKRRISAVSFNRNYASYMDGANIIEQRHGQTLLQITISDRTEDLVSISYTYSRPARDQDPIFNPGRSNSSATDIPEALFHEVGGLRHLEGPFKDVFNEESTRNDRLLNWLMRTIRVDATDLRNAADQGVVLIGDAVHAEPILGGYGANDAILDAVELAKHISNKGPDNLSKFNEARSQAWQKSMEDSEAQLAVMHSKTTHSL